MHISGTYFPSDSAHKRRLYFCKCIAWVGRCFMLPALKMRRVKLSSLVAVVLMVGTTASDAQSAVYDYAGGTHLTGQKSNNWNYAASWTNGPGAFPNAPGDCARTASFVNGSVDLYLNEDITLGTLTWSGLVLCIYGGTPGGKLIVDNAGRPSVWRLWLTDWLWLDADIVLSNELRLVVTNSAGFGERVVPARLGGVISGPGKLILDCQTPNLNTFQLGIGRKTPNSHTGGTRLIGHPSGRVYFEAMKSGFFGVGDVELTGFAKLVLRNRFETNDYIADTAALWLETENVSNRPTVYIEPGLDEKVAKLYIDGLQMPSGVYGGPESGASEKLDDFFSGPGTLTVLTGPASPGVIRNLPPVDATPPHATICGELVATNAAPTLVYVYWGTKDGGMLRDAWENEVCLGPREPGVFSVQITNYTPAQTVYYRAYMTNALGGKWSGSTAKLCLPVVQNEMPIVQPEHVTLRGSVLSTGGPPTVLTVFWGRTDAGTNTAAWEHATVLGVTSGGLLGTNVTGLLSETVYYYRVHGSNIAGVNWAAHSDAFKTTTTSVWGDITFVVASDLHHGATWHVPTADETCRCTIENINSIVGQSYPAGVGGGFVAPLRGVLLVGDLTEGRTLQQWMDFTNTWGLIGERLLRFPVYEAFGNHDAGSTYGVVPAGIKARNPHRPGLRNISTNGYHYSFDWDFLHIVCLNVFPGNEVYPGYSYPDPSNSLAFLQSDLTEFVGPSDRPVLIYHHYGFDTYGLSSWSEQQRNNYFQIITNYNVVCIFSGHSHTLSFGTWRGVTTCIDGAAGKFIGNFVLAHLTRTNLVLLERTSQNKWGMSFAKQVSVPACMAVSNGDGAIDVTTNSARLTGWFLMNGPPPVHIYACWGRTNGSTNAFAWENVVNLGELPLGRFSLLLTNLAEGTTYYYRCFASNQTEIAWASASAQFTTPSVNTPPILTPVPEQITEAGETLRVTNVATDAESPPQTLAFSLLSGPEGAFLGQDTGVFIWRPSASSIFTTNTVVLMVCDDGMPPLSATQSFDIVVLPPTRPLIVEPTMSNDVFTMKIWGGSSDRHIVEVSTNLQDWVALLTTNGPLLPFYLWDSNLSGYPVRFYRVRCGH